jgi:spore coat-associated protein N
MRTRLHIVSRLALLLLALGTAGYSGASFVSKSANGANAFAAGRVTQQNSRAGQLIVSASGMVPGQSTARTLTITNSGDIASTSTLSAAVADSPGPAGVKLSGELHLTVADVTDPSAPRTVYDGALGAMGPQTLGTSSPGSARTYRFTVAFPEAASQNAYQGAATDVEFDWTQTS